MTLLGHSSTPDSLFTEGQTLIVTADSTVGYEVSLYRWAQWRIVLDVKFQVLLVVIDVVMVAANVTSHDVACQTAAMGLI